MPRRNQPRQLAITVLVIILLYWAVIWISSWLAKEQDKQRIKQLEQRLDSLSLATGTIVTNIRLHKHDH